VIAALAAAAVLATPACAPSVLHYRTTFVDAGAGTFVVHLQVGAKTAPCTVSGYPRLEILGSKGRKLRTRVVHGGLALLQAPVRRIVVTRGRPAHLLVADNDVPVGSETTCPSGTALLVNGVRVNVATTACSRGRLLESPYIR
jgi:hypothetical protein